MRMNVEPERAEVYRGWAVECVVGPVARCGYARVPAGHALHGRSYGDAVPGCAWADLQSAPIGKRGPISLFCMDPTKPPRLEDWFDVHGSLTFSGARRDDEPADWWLGFDCGHAGDDEPGGRSVEYVMAELHRLVDQIEARWPLFATPTRRYATGEDA